MTEKKNIKFGLDAVSKMKEGVDILANAVKVTLGAKGKNVIISKEFGQGLQSTKDGVTVAKAIPETIKDPFIAAGASAAEEVATRVVELVGDGTTTATVLAQSILEQGFRMISAGEDPIQLKNEMQEAVKQVVDNLEEQSQKVTYDKVKDIATISANNDSEIGEMIYKAVKKVGKDGIITLEKSKSKETYVDIIDGLEFEGGYLSHYFVNNTSKMTTEYDNVIVYIYEGNITNVNQIIPVLEYTQQNNLPLLIITNDMSGEVINLLALNKVQNGLKVAVVSTDYVGGLRTEFLKDIAIVTNATPIISDLNDFDPNVLGSCDKIIVKKDSTVIVGGHGDKSKVKDRVKSLKELIKDKKQNKKILGERISKLSGGIAVIHVGGNTKQEMGERFDRVEDALSAVKSAMDEGYVDGGGMAYMRASESLVRDDKGTQIIKRAVQEPFNQIVRNAGQEPAEIKLSIRELDNYFLNNSNDKFGYNAKTDKIENMEEEGIIDPKKVTRVALESALSIVELMLSTGCIIIK